MAAKSPAEILESLEEQEAAHAVARSAYRHRRTVADLRREIRELNATVDALEEDVATLEALRTPPPKQQVMSPPKRTKRTKGEKLPAAFVALASDWHTCEIVTERQTGGRNKHDQSIGTERAWRWARGLVRMCQDEQARADVQTLVLWLGGDFLVNDGLHYKSERACDLSPPDEARFIRDLLAQIITYLRAELDVPRIVIPTSWGNHDRSTDKMVPGHAGDYSHIQPVYRDLAAWFSGNQSIEFRIAEAEWLAVDVHGYPLLFHHGHNINYGGGVLGLGVPVLKAVGSLRSDYAFRTLNIGHFHQWGVHRGGEAISNGSLVGPNGYSRDRKFPSEPPRQAAYLIDLERLEIGNYFSIWGT